MNKSESKYFNTAHRIDEALLPLLYEKDLEYVTVKEICDRADVNRSTLIIVNSTYVDHSMFLLSAVTSAAVLLIIVFISIRLVIRAVMRKL